MPTDTATTPVNTLQSGDPHEARVNAWKDWVRARMPGDYPESLRRDVENLQRGKTGSLMVEGIAKGLTQISEGFRPPDDGEAVELSKVLQGCGTMLSAVWRVDEPGLTGELRTEFLRSLITGWSDSSLRAPGDDSPRPEREGERASRERTGYWDAAVNLLLAIVQIWAGVRLVKEDVDAGGTPSKDDLATLARGVASLFHALCALVDALDGNGYVLVTQPDGSVAAAEIEGSEDFGSALRQWFTDLGTIAHEIVELAKKIEEVRPSDLRGRWTILGDDDPHGWRLLLDAPNDEGVYSGQLEVTGVDRSGQVLRRSHGTVEVRLRGTQTAVIHCRRRPSPGLGTSLDRALEAGATEATHEAKVVVDARELQLEGADLLGAPADLSLTRDTSPAAFLQLLGQVSRTVWTLRLMIPASWRKDWAKELADSLKTWLEAYPRLRWLREHVSLKAEEAKEANTTAGIEAGDLLLGFGVKNGAVFGASASWNLSRLFRDDAFEGARHPLVPTDAHLDAISARAGIGFALDWRPLRPGEELGARSTIGDKLPFLAELIETHLSAPGLDWRTLTPELSLPAADKKDALPEIRFPVEVFVRELAGFQLDSKVTLKLKLTGQALANYLPQLRACLAAWRIGCAIGTLLHDLLIRFEAVQRLEEAVAERAAGWIDSSYEGNRRYNHYANQLLAPVLATRVLNRYERAIFIEKFDLFMRGRRNWRRRNLAEGTRERLFADLARAVADLETPDPDLDNAHRIACEAQALLYQYLLGDGPSYEEVVQALTRAVEDRLLSRPACFLYMSWIEGPIEYQGRTRFREILSRLEGELDPRDPFHPFKYAEIERLKALQAISIRDFEDTRYGRDPFLETCSVMLQSFPWEATRELDKAIWAQRPPSHHWSEEEGRLLFELRDVPEPDGTRLYVRFFDYDDEASGRDSASDDLLTTPGYKDHYSLTVRDGTLRVRDLHDYTLGDTYGGESVIECYPAVYADKDGEPDGLVWEPSTYRRLRVTSRRIAGLA